MAQLQRLKPSVFKNVLKHTNVRFFSSRSTPTYPFMLIDYVLNTPRFPPDGHVTKFSENNLTNCSKQTKISIKDSKLAEEVRDAMTCGFLRNGPGLTIVRKTNDDDDSLRISIVHPLTYPNLTDVSAFLPLLPSGYKIQNIAMSSLPNRDKDWVVGVKSSGSRLSLCRPFGNPKWIHIDSMPENIHPFASLMFSKRDQKFYIPSTGSNYLCSFDLHFKEGNRPQFLMFGTDELPVSAFRDLDHASSCSKTDHLVESPTGELFLVKWYGEDSDEDYDYEHGRIRTLMHKTKQFMVFRADEHWCESDELRMMIYTEDIGDLCIFVGHSEAFCVPASSSPGLKPNCIYFVGYSFGVFDLTTKMCTTLFTYDEDKLEIPLRNLDFPYWPPPFPISTRP